MVMRDKIDANTHIAISIATAQHKTSDIWQLVQSSARASANLTFEALALLPAKTFSLHQLMDLICGVSSQIQTLLLFTMLIEENEIRIVSRNEIDFQPCISVSVSRLFHESPDFRQMVQASARTCLHFCSVSSLRRHDNTILVNITAIGLCLLESHT